MREDPGLRAFLEASLGTEEAARTMAEFFAPEDAAFIDYLVQKYGNSAVAEQWRAAFAAPLSARMRAALQTEPGFAALTPAGRERAYKRAVAAAHDPTEMVEGRHIVLLRMSALRVLLEATEGQSVVRGLQRAPVLRLPANDINGFVVAGPSGRPAIVLNQAVAWVLPWVMTTLYAASGLAAEDGALGDWSHPPEAHAETLIALADLVRTQDTALIARAPTLGDIPAFVGWSSVMTWVCEHFLLFHEYAHVFDRHYAEDGVLAQSMLQVAQYFTPKLNQEVYADQFAINSLLHPAASIVHDDGQAIPVDTKIAAVTALFQFLGVVELRMGRHLEPGSPQQTTYPTWARLKLLEPRMMDAVGSEPVLSRRLRLVFNSVIAEVQARPVPGPA